MEVNFDAKNDAQKVFLQIKLWFGKRPLTVPWFSKKDYCQIENGIQCPIGKNKTYNLKLFGRVPKHTPNLIATMEMMLFNERKRKLLCLQTPLIIHK